MGNISFGPDKSGEGSVVSTEAQLQKSAATLGIEIRDRNFAVNTKPPLSCW